MEAKPPRMAATKGWTVRKCASCMRLTNYLPQDAMVIRGRWIPLFYVKELGIFSLSNV